MEASPLMRQPTFFTASTVQPTRLSLITRKHSPSCSASTSVKICLPVQPSLGLEYWWPVRTVTGLLWKLHQAYVFFPFQRPRRLQPRHRLRHPLPLRAAVCLFQARYAEIWFSIIPGKTSISQTPPAPSGRLTFRRLVLGRSTSLAVHSTVLDIARDDSFLLVAQNTTSGSQGTFHKVDLATGVVTNINYTRVSRETGAWDVAIGSNGLAFVSTRFAGSGLVPVRQIDLATNMITIRSDVPGSGGSQVRQSAVICRSADGTRLFLMEGDTSQGPMFTYSATSNTFWPGISAGGFLNPTTGAVNRDGSLVVLRTFGGPASLRTAPGLNVVHSFSEIDGGVAFDAKSDTLYGLNSTDRPDYCL